MKRLIVVFAAVLVGALMLVATGSASVNFVTLNHKATLGADGSVIVSGTTLCTAGHDATAAVIVTRSTGNATTVGSGTSGEFTCTGTFQSWSVVVQPLLGPGFKKGKASISIAQVSDNTDNTFAATTGRVTVN